MVDPVNAMWRLMVLDTDGKQTPESIDKDALIRRAVGRPFEVEWLSASIWTRRSVVAERYSKGRVFLAGDAVHQLSPTGALGMNTGIGDAVDLGWKLAAVVQGWGGPNLLASYDGERRPIGLRTIDNTAGFHLAHGQFESGFSAIEDDSDAGPRAARPSRAATGAQVGAHVSHHRPAARLSLRGLADLRARRHAGAAGRSGELRRLRAAGLARAACRARRRQLDARSVWPRLRAAPARRDAPDGAEIAKAAKKRGVPLRTVTIDEPEAATIYERKLVLVRPDGHVAWRGDEAPSDALAMIDRVRGA